MPGARALAVLFLLAALPLVACIQDPAEVRARVQTRLARAESTAGPPAATPTPTASARPVQWYAVGNTGGDGVYIRRTPRALDRIMAWPDGTAMESLLGDVETEGRLWRKVRDPRGNEGWVPAEYLVPRQTPDPQPTARVPAELQELYRRAPGARAARAQLGLDLFVLDFGPAGRADPRLEAQVFDWYLDAAPGRTQYELRIRAGANAAGEPIERIWRWNVAAHVLHLAETAPPGAPPFACWRWVGVTSDGMRRAAASAEGWGVGGNDDAACGLAAPTPTPAPAPATATARPATPTLTVTPLATQPPRTLATATPASGPQRSPTAPASPTPRR